MGPENYLDLEIQDNNPQWMKFVDYYNEFREEKFGEKGHFEYENRFDDVHIISKKMKFMYWLVSHQKIDVEKLEQTDHYLITFDRDYYKIREKEAFSFDHFEDIAIILIAYLSIQDNPITFILNILK